MQGRIRIASGLAFLAVGLVWIGQGVGWIGGSFMTGEGIWAVIGIVCVAIGGTMVARGLKDERA